MARAICPPVAEKGRSVVAIHLPPPAEGIMRYICIKLCKEIFRLAKVECQQQITSAVIVGAPVARPIGLSHRYLKKLFTIVRNAEFGPASQDFLTDEYTDFTT